VFFGAMKEQIKQALIAGEAKRAEKTRKAILALVENIDVPGPPEAKKELLERSITEVIELGKVTTLLKNSGVGFLRGLAEELEK
jgi:hypothetical protein